MTKQVTDAVRETFNVAKMDSTFAASEAARKEARGQLAGETIIMQGTLAILGKDKSEARVEALANAWMRRVNESKTKGRGSQVANCVRVAIYGEQITSTFAAFWRKNDTGKLAAVPVFNMLAGKIARECELRDANKAQFIAPKRVTAIAETVLRERLAASKVQGDKDKSAEARKVAVVQALIALANSETEGGAKYGEKQAKQFAAKWGEAFTIEKAKAFAQTKREAKKAGK